MSSHVVKVESVRSVCDSSASLTRISSSTQRSGKVVASSSRKRVRTGTTIPPALAVPRGQTQHYGAKAVTSEGKKWYKSHTEAKYFSNVILDDVQLEREFPQIMRRLQDLRMGFIFQDPSECNVSVVREFYANWKHDARSHFVAVRSVEVSLTPSMINQVLGTSEAPSDILIGLNISPPYQQIRHILCGMQPTFYPYAHMNRESWVWLKLVMNCLIQGLHFTKVTRDRVCLVYALMKDLPINMAQVHQGRRYAFGGLITNLCRQAGVPEESVDYMAPLFTTPLHVTKTKGPKNFHGPTLTTTECSRRDDLITTHMFGLEMLFHRNGCRVSTQEQLDEIARMYPLNEHDDALLGLGPAFLEPIWVDVPTDEDKRRTMSHWGQYCIFKCGVGVLYLCKYFCFCYFVLGSLEVVFGSLAKDSLVEP
ncbi:hypothetical protein R3W88_026949 [Solanum pinnatisectum]|uniref:Putative plant transposon protein domain-containing protein n=1 Tax=Solanum pinnatisectum TaxID=50273 RepID=A0AAV9LH81_9SOLN|nr:hypothetical protein R3W88_026949 [Solanum pinnatisectum]